MRPRLLAVDTTSEHGSIALIEDGELLDVVGIHSPDGFSQVLFGELQKLLAARNLGIKDMSAFAAANGPGSFTGVRVGLAAVKGLAEATGTPVFAVSNLQAMALFGSRSLRAPVIDARRGEVYGAVYNSDFELVLAETVMPLDTWIEGLPEGDLEIVTCGVMIPDLRRVTEAPKSLAGAVGQIAARRLLKGAIPRPEDVDANYVRRSDAELKWRES